MKIYSVPTRDGKREQITEEEYISLFGEEQYRSYANKLYLGTISLEDVPEDVREQAQSIVRKRTAKYGTYDDYLATPQDINQALQTLTDYNLTKGELKKLIPALLYIRDNATDAVASRTANIFPMLKGDGELIKAGTRIQWANTIKRASVDLWDTIENNPEFAPSLWEDINYYNGYRIIPEVITVSAAFSKDEIGLWKDKLYKSLIDANVYTPDEYSAGWQEVTEE